MRRLKTKLFLPLLLIILCLTGCSESVEQPQESQESADVLKTPVDSTAITWQRQASLGEESWNISGYKDFLCPIIKDKSANRVFHASVDSRIYLVTEHTEFSSSTIGKFSASEYCMTSIDTDTEQSSSHMVPFHFSEKTEATAASQAMEEAIANQKIMLLGFDVVNETSFFFLMSWDEEGNTTNYFSAEVDGEGNVMSVLDLLEASKDSGFFTEKRGMPNSANCDNAGNIYLFDEAWDLYQFDSQGSLLQKYELAEENGSSPQYMGKLPDGVPIYMLSDKHKHTTRLLSPINGKMETLYEDADLDASQMFVNQYGENYYFDNHNLYRWDIKTGSCTAIYHNETMQPLLLGANSNGEVYMVVQGIGDIELYMFSDKEQPQIHLALYQCLYYADYIRDCAEAYSKIHPNITIDIIEADISKDSWLNTLLADISVGKGPDMIIADRKTLTALKEKDALTTLDDVMDEETLEQISKGILDNGRIDGQLYGITPQAIVRTLIVSDDLWKETGWDLSDIMQLMQKEKSLKYVFADLDYNVALNTLKNLLFYTENTGLIDLQEKKAYFNTEEFISLLQLCKLCEANTQSGETRDSEEIVRLLRDKEALAIQFGGSFTDFSKLLEQLGDGYHCVGFPSVTDESSYFQFSEGCIAVSRYTDETESIQDFLKFTLSYSSQKKYWKDGVRKDILKESIIEKVCLFGDTRPSAYFQSGISGYIPLSCRKDGSSFLPEYLALWNSCCSNNMDYWDILMIILEEADVYFKDGKSAEAVADIIQSRIQLYLDEQMN